jgi:cytochrome c peroxidase
MGLLFSMLLERRVVLALAAALPLAATVLVAQERRPATIEFVSSNRPPRLIKDMKPVPAPADNPETPAKTALGRRLFFDTILSKDRTVSCSTCHDPARGFADDKALAVGIAGRVGKRHSPTLINRAFGRMQFWDGRVVGLEAQVLLPISDVNEMDLSIEEAVTRLGQDPAYTTEFKDVFGATPTAPDLGRALATFLRSLRSDDTPYDRFMAGDSAALSAEEHRGLEVFRRKGRCIFCHVEPLFSDDGMHNTGVAWNAETSTFKDDGRFAVTSRPADRGKFKTPTLRDIARSSPYMHDGSLATLQDVIDFYDKGGRPNPGLIVLIQPLGLAAEEKTALVKFLEALNSR